MRNSQKIAVVLAGVLIAAYAATACLWSVNTPIFEAPDEPGHIEYVARLVLERRLPLQDVVQRNYAHHPPLYYVVAAMVSSGIDWQDQRDMPVWVGRSSGAGLSGQRALHGTAENFPWRGRVAAVHAVRFLSVACGVVAVACTIAAGWAAFPERRAIGLLAGALLAWTPQFTFMSAAVNNDAASAAFGAAVTWAVLRALRHPLERRRWLLLGAVSGAGLLTKVTVAGVVVAAFAAWAVSVGRFDSKRAWAVSGALLIGAAAAVSGWWFVRNIVHYGDPFGWSAYRVAWAEMVRRAPPTATEWLELADLQWRSYWGWFGWLTRSAGEWLYIGANVLVGAAVVGGVRSRAALAVREWRPGLWTCAAVFVGQQAFLIGQNVLQGAVMAQGRHLFSASAAAMLLVGCGLLAGARSGAERGRRAALVAVAMAAANLISLASAG